MLGRIPLLTCFRLWAVLLVGIIGLHATAPTAPSPHKIDGSAFSAATYEVALFVQRADRGQRQSIAVLPATAFGVVTEAHRAAGTDRLAGPTMRPDSTGPPLRDIRAWQPAPRGPPTA